MRRLLLILLLASPCWAQIVHVSSACSKAANAGNAASGVYTISCTPNATNHAVTIGANCGGSAASAASISASGWTFTSLVALQGTATQGFFAMWGALTPNTSATTITITFTGAGTCNGFSEYVSDEWSGNDTTGGATTFYTSNHNTGTTAGCSGAAVTSTSSNDAVVSVCADSLPASSWSGAGWTTGVNDSGGSGSEFKIVTGAQTPTWTSTSGAFNVGSTTIKAAGGTSGPNVGLKGKVGFKGKVGIL